MQEKAPEAPSPSCDRKRRYRDDDKCFSLLWQRYPTARNLRLKLTYVGWSFPWRWREWRWFCNHWRSLEFFIYLLGQFTRSKKFRIKFNVRNVQPNSSQRFQHCSKLAFLGSFEASFTHSSVLPQRYQIEGAAISGDQMCAGRSRLLLHRYNIMREWQIALLVLLGVATLNDPRGVTSLSVFLLLKLGEIYPF